MADEQELRIDELARRAGTTVRNVRAYQDRGLLPGPRREGRIGWYSAAHLARLRLIGELLERGYTLANIGELLAAWERGQDIGALLGFEAALGAAWSEDRTAVVSPEELADLLGGTPDEGSLAAAIGMGLLEPVGDGFLVRNPSALEIGLLLLAEGVPLAAVLAAGQRLHDDIDGVAGRLVDLVDRQVVRSLPEPLGAEDLARLTRLVERLRPLAKQAVDDELAAAMERHIRVRFGEHLRRVAESRPERGRAS
ncbi:MAG: MerR family transcriptional regulator [Acidimicrobiales bacterium]